MRLRRDQRDRARRPRVLSLSRRVMLSIVALASLTVLVVVLSLSAPGHRPTGDYAPFSRCPVSRSATSLCLFTQTEGGEFIAGERKVPISRTITLQGGVHVVENREKEIVREEMIAAEGGETLSKTPQPVPGGLSKIVDPKRLPAGLRTKLDKLIAGGSTAVTATIELAAPPGSIGVDVQDLIEAEGVALSLPVKVKLSNAFLGESCYLGSNAHPISLPLTTGRTDPPRPNRPIRGKVGKAKLEDEYNLTIIRESSLVNNTFASPGAEGCGGVLSSLVDPAVDAELALPAAAGRNTAILDGTLRDANAPAVKASE